MTGLPRANNESGAHRLSNEIPEKEITMSTYVLIHGAWRGGWCWGKVAPILKQSGHYVVALDLPGFGKDNRPLSEVSRKHGRIGNKSGVDRAALDFAISRRIDHGGWVPKGKKAACLRVNRVLAT